MTDLPRIEWTRPKQGAAAEAIAEEWLVTNGLGGYASGTVAMCNTRKYHGLFVPSLPGFGRHPHRQRGPPRFGVERRTGDTRHVRRGQIGAV